VQRELSSVPTQLRKLVGALHPLELCAESAPCSPGPEPGLRVRAQSSRREERSISVTWRAFDEMSGVLELDAPELELHWQLMGGRSFAWWCDEQGRCLGIVRVGVA
jgi:hypothetical protein